jgi:hypothetical protein
MAKVRAKKARRRSRAIVRGHLERINSRVFENYRDQITALIGRNHGVYVLYRRDKLYYVGLASDLKGRIRHHLRDRHKGKWDRFSLYIIRKEDHIREVESLLTRIAEPPGNKVRGKLGKSKNLLPYLRKMVTSQAKKEIESLFKEPEEATKRKTKKKVKKKSKKIKVQKVERPLKGLFPGGKRLYATYKGTDYKAWVYRSGTIKYNSQLYNSPTGAAKAVVGRMVNGWRFWKYKDEKGNVVQLRNRRK